MKVLRLFSLLALTIFSQIVIGQNRVSWKMEIEQEVETAKLIITATPENGFHLYSQKEDAKYMNTPTKFTFEDQINYKTVGETKEPKAHEETDEFGDINLEFHDYPVVFEQDVEITSQNDGKIKVYVEYQTCNDVGCFQEFANLEVSFTGNPNATAPAATTSNGPCGCTVPCEYLDVIMKAKGGADAKNDSLAPIVTQVYSKKLSNGSYEVYVKGFINPAWKLYFGGFNTSSINLPEGFEIIESSIKSDAPDTVGTSFNISYAVPSGYSDSIVPIDLWYVAESNGAKYSGSNNYEYNLNKSLEIKEVESESSSYWAIFIFAFLSGFTALLTPCVFPMIPMTVSFFTKQSKTKAIGIRNAIIYGLSIIVIYVGLGLVVTGIFGADALNALSTNVWFNLFFFLLLFIFGISFLGGFEIALPSSWINKADKNADKGGLIGIFFMAFTLSLVSFSCTGPIIGTLLVQAATEGGMAPFFGMFGFSLALALPFALFAAFPGWMNSLPQSGGWLNSVKVVLGLLEIAFSFKFLSNADLVVQAHLLEREVFLAIWIALFALLGMYLLGKIQLPHDSPTERIGVSRFLFAGLVFSFVIYLIPGMWGAPLKLISGFPPPSTYSESPYGIGGVAPSEEDLPEGAHIGPHGVILFHELELAEKYAKEQGLPVLKDFTGWACVNCRRMEENVWTDPKVMDILKNKVVIASLHVDDQTMLPENEWTTAEDGGKIRTIGNKWSAVQRLEYGSQSQPQYFMLTAEGDRLGNSASYENHGKPELFLEWLEQNLEQYELISNADKIEVELKKI